MKLTRITPKPCERCGVIMRRTHKESKPTYERRRFCSRECSVAAFLELRAKVAK